MNVGLKKKPKAKNPDMKAKKETVFDTLIKRSASLPAPWKYDVAPQWGQPNVNDLPPKEAQIAKYRWQGVSKDEMKIEKPVKIKPKKIDMNTKKNTYVELIIAQNSKEQYPKPGPANYFMDIESAKKYYKENIDLLQKKTKDEKEKSKLP